MDIDKKIDKGTATAVKAFFRILENVFPVDDIIVSHKVDPTHSDKIELMWVFHPHPNTEGHKPYGKKYTSFVDYFKANYKKIAVEIVRDYARYLAEKAK